MDLVLSNEEGMIQDIEYLSPLAKSDHIVISFNLICYIQQLKRVKEIYCHEKGNYTNMREELEQINWNEELGNREKDINTQWNFIKGKIKESMEKHILKRKIKIGDKKPKCRLDSKMRALIKRKHRAWQRYSESNYMDENKLMMFRRLRNKVRKVTRYQQKCQEKEIANEAKTNPKKFWQYVNRRTKTTSRIADLETPNNTLTSKDNEKAEILANFFTSVFTEEKLGDIPTIQNKIVHKDLKQFTIEVRKKLMKLNPAKSSGPDNLHSKILKELANVYR